MLIPAIAVAKGRLLGGREVEPLLNSLPYDTFYLIDMNGIERYKPQIELIRKLSSKKTLWVNAGTRRAVDIFDPLVAGAEKLILGTKTLESLLELKKAHQLSPHLILGIDWRGGILAKNQELSGMRVHELVNLVKKIGVNEFLLTTNDPGMLSTLPRDINIYITGDERTKITPPVKGIVIDALRLYERRKTNYRLDFQKAR